MRDTVDQAHGAVPRILADIIEDARRAVCGHCCADSPAWRAHFPAHPRRPRPRCRRSRSRQRQAAGANISDGKYRSISSTASGTPSVTAAISSAGPASTASTPSEIMLAVVSCPATSSKNARLTRSRPARPTAVRCAGHQLVAVPVPPPRPAAGRARPRRAGGHLGGVHAERRLTRDGHPRQGHRAVHGLPVHLGQPRAGQVTALQARGDQRRDHAPDPVALPRRRGGVDELLHVPGRDVLAEDRVDDRGGEPLAQPALGMRVLAGPLPLDRRRSGDR